jgi:hypothetical protein
VRVVDLGPFKHTVDDGLELRKSAFECLDTLLDSYLDCLDAAEFLKHLQVLTSLPGSCSTVSPCARLRACPLYSTAIHVDYLTNTQALSCSRQRPPHCCGERALDPVIGVPRVAVREAERVS